jgi:hypothetical protein
MTSTLLYERRVDLIVGGHEVTGLRTVFKVEKTSKPEPSKLDLSIYNLNAASRAQLQGRGVPVILKGGYAQRTGLIFSGQSRTIDHVHTGPDWVTHVQCGDGETAYVEARISSSFAPGTRVGDVIVACGTALGLNPGNMVAQAEAAGSGDLQQFVQGYQAHGSAATELTKVLRALGYSWSIQDGKLQLLAVGAAMPGEALLLNANTGLIGTPEHGTPPKPGKPGYLKIKCLLQPDLRPGSRIQLDSLGIKGLYRAVDVRHDGDTHSGNWYSEVEALSA